MAIISNPAHSTYPTILEEQLTMEDEDDIEIIIPDVTDFEKEILIEWASNQESMTLMDLINILFDRMKNANGHSFWDRLKNLDFTEDNGLHNNIMVKILVTYYCRMIDAKNNIETNTTPKLVSAWNEFKQYYFQITD